MRIDSSCEVIDPDGGVDYGHAGGLLLDSTEARLVQVPFPLNFSAEAADCGLRLCFDEQTQAGFDGGSLGGGAGGAHGLLDQLIVDIDIGAQVDFPDV